MSLSEAEQAELVDGLLAALDGEESELDRMSDDELAAELDRRADELQQDPSAGLPWERVQHMR